MNFLARTIFLRLFLLCLTFTGHNSFAQETFNLKSSSTIYDLEVRIDRCDEDRRKDDASTCSGPGRVSIYDKGATAPFQILMFKNLEVNKEQLAYNSDVDKSARKLYDDEYSFIFGDFNFDGTEDLAICNGREGGYGAPSYNVYLYNVTSQKFVENIKLSRLTEGAYLGLFFVDSKKKRLTAHSKSGCCHHETEVYKVIRNRPVLVERIIEEASGSDTAGYVVVITTRKLVNGKWIKRVRKEKLPEETP